MDQTVTFCTFFFDIGRTNWGHYGLANSTYMHWFQNLLSLNIHLYIETEEKFVTTIKEMRRRVDPDFKKTIIVSKTIEQLPSYNIYNERLTELMNSEDFKNKVHHKVPEMTQVLYNILMFNKVYTLKNAIQNNYFNTNFFSWVDAGFIRDSSWIINNQNWPDPTRLNLQENKIRFFCIEDTLLQNLKHLEYHCMSQFRYLKGTIFFLDKNCIDLLILLFEKTVNHCIQKRFLGSDEKMFDLCYLSNPNVFELVKCDWRQEFSLYAKRHNKEYSLTIKWNPEDIERSDDYKFWYVGIEDDTTAVIYRHDFTPEDHPDFLAFKKFEFPVKFHSFTAPNRVIIWPVSHSKSWLKRVVYKF